MRKPHSFTPNCESMEDRTLLSVSVPKLSPASPAIVANPGKASFNLWAISSTQVQFQWAVLKGDTGYQVQEAIYTTTYRRVGHRIVPKVTTTWATVAAFGQGSTGGVVGGLNPSTYYTFRVLELRGRAKVTEAAKSVVTLAPRPAPATPTLYVSVISTTQINLRWDGMGNVDRFIVVQLINNTWQQIAVLDGNSTGFNVTGLTKNTTYYFDVVAQNSSGTTWGTSKGGTTLNDPVPPPHPAIDNPYTTHSYFASPQYNYLWDAGGPNYTDVNQGEAGDCWLLSTLSAVVARRAEYITSMFTYLGTWQISTGTVSFYSIRLFDNTLGAHSVVVDTELPSGNYSGGYAYDQPTHGIWAALIEKAYAVANGHGWVNAPVPWTDSYYALGHDDVGGIPAWAMTAVVGHYGTDVAVSSTTISGLWSQYIFVIWTSKPGPTDSHIVAGHAYAVVAVDPSSTMPFKGYNPWGQNANGTTTWRTFIANGPFIDQQFYHMSLVKI